MGLKWLKGYIICGVGSGYWERFMNLCRHHRIHLWDVKIQESKVTFSMFSKDYKTLHAFVAKTHIAPKIREKRGLPFVLDQAKRDWTFTLGLVLFFVVLKVLSLFVWQINYYGQQEYTKETISKEVESMGVYVGMMRKNLFCDDIERSLRESYENMSWVSAEEKGCVLNIKIKEGKALKGKEEENDPPSHVTAPCDGVIEKIVTRQGTAKVAKGAKVKKGDILISGIVEIKGDGGETVRCNGVCAEGEISILTKKEFDESINERYMAKNKTGEEIHVYTVCINGTRFSIKNPLKWFDKSSNYDIINNVCVDREFIPWNSRLKVTDHKYVNYDKVEARYSEKEAGERLKARFQSRLEEYREAGCRIVDQSLDIKKEPAAYKAHGSIQLSISKMDKKNVSEEELVLPGEGKEDEDGAGTDNS